MAQDNSALGNASDKYFLIRRLHSLSGLIPLGVFLLMHLGTNFTILLAGDGSEFQTSVERIHSLGGLLIPVEIIGIFIPLAFHTLVGIGIATTSKQNYQSYSYNSNIRYWLQRVTAYIALVFIVYHIYQMHWMGSVVPGGGGGQFKLFEGGGHEGAPTGAKTTAMAIQSAWWIAPLYAIGIVATVFHLANGVWTALITWGITVRPRTQKISGYVCTTLGILLVILGMGSLWGFKNFKTDQVQPTTHQSTTQTDAKNSNTDLSVANSG